MLGVPEKYYIGKKMGISQFIPKDIKPQAKKRLKEALKTVTLAYQINGEEIPSRVDTQYNCQIIMFFDIKLTHIKEAKFVGDLLQKALKPFAVIRFFDDNEQVYHLAEKRLHATDKNEIVVESTVITPPFSCWFGDELEEAVEKYVSIAHLINTQDKVALYTEMLVKVYILTNPEYQREQERFWQSKIWYNHDQVQLIYQQFKKIDELKNKKGTTLKEKVDINVDIKEQLDQLYNLL